MQDLFNFIEDRFFEDHITVKLSIFESHPTKGFRDLLITRDFEFQPYTLPVGDNQLLGIPETTF
jgi:kinesin family protein 18/19